MTKIYNTWNELHKDRYSQIDGDDFEASEIQASIRLSEVRATYKHFDWVLFRVNWGSDEIHRWNIVRKRTFVKIVELLCEGNSTKEICEALDLTMHHFKEGLRECYSCIPHEKKRFPVYKDDILKNIVKLLKYQHEQKILYANFRKSLKNFDH